MQVNGVNGILMTGPNGNTIFLPNAGYRSGGDLKDADSGYYYWSSTLNGGYSVDAFYLGVYSIMMTSDRYRGLTVRAVRP